MEGMSLGQQGPLLQVDQKISAVNIQEGVFSKFSIALFGLEGEAAETLAAEQHPVSNNVWLDDALPQPSGYEKALCKPASKPTPSSYTVSTFQDGLRILANRVAISCEGTACAEQAIQVRRVTVAYMKFFRCF